MVLFGIGPIVRPNERVLKSGLVVEVNSSADLGPPLRGGPKSFFFRLRRKNAELTSTTKPDFRTLAGVFVRDVS